jgi:hypothetical protein
MLVRVSCICISAVSRSMPENSLGLVTRKPVAPVPPETWARSSSASWVSWALSLSWLFLREKRNSSLHGMADEAIRLVSAARMTAYASGGRLRLWRNHDMAAT